ncbi:MAG: class I SAM-dependent methyltransferase [Enterococcus sp.]
MNDRNAFTRKLFLDSGIEAGMRILDVGCGAGEVSFLMQEILGDTSEIVGIDINEELISAAQNIATERGCQHARFFTMDIADAARELGTFDAIIGRRILMYLPDPFQTIKDLITCLKPGGRIVFQESDAIGAGELIEKFPLHTRVQQWVWETVAKEQGNIHIGSELYTLFLQAGLQIQEVRSEAVLQTIETGSDLAWLLKVMEKRIIQAEVATKDEMDEISEEKLMQEMEKAQSVFIRDMNFGIYATK